MLAETSEAENEECAHFGPRYAQNARREAHIDNIKEVVVVEGDEETENI